MSDKKLKLNQTHLFLFAYFPDSLFQTFDLPFLSLNVEELEE